MKKSIKWLSALALMIMGAFMFSACGDDDDESNTPSQQRKTIDGYEYVDLGLSVKWATCNVNAKSFLDAGGFFQYGNPHSLSFVSDYQLPTYEIGGTDLDPATFYMGSKWRMPTRAEMLELVNGCTWKVTTSNSGQRYYIGTSKKNSRQIFIPASGAYPLGNTNSSIVYENQQCWLMTSTLDDSGNPRPYILKIQYLSDSNNSINVTTNEVGRYSGMPVRAVSVANGDGESGGDNGQGDNGNAKPFGEAPETAEAVDLGLPSGTLWANMNVGATKAGEVGDYFAWGEVEPKEFYSWDTYKWSTQTGQTKYIKEEQELELEDDAAYMNWGKDWRMPSRAQIDELFNYTRQETYGSQSGVYIISEINGEAIFFPASGGLKYEDMPSGNDGFYWSRTGSMDSSGEGFGMIFHFTFSYDDCSCMYSSYERCIGQNVRAVRNK